jgi:hypothetical protein
VARCAVSAASGLPLRLPGGSWAGNARALRASAVRPSDVTAVTMARAMRRSPVRSSSGGSVSASSSDALRSARMQWMSSATEHTTGNCRRERKFSRS